MDDFSPGITQAPFAHGLDEALPDTMLVGKGAMLPVRGWCYSPDDQLAGLEIVVDGVATSIANHSWGRLDVFVDKCPGQDSSGNSLLSGFEGLVPFASPGRDRDVALWLRATLTRGKVIERLLGTIRLLTGDGVQPTAVTWPADGPRIAICMAMFDPPADLFQAQIASIQAQTHANWVCIISDDDTSNEHYDRVRMMVKHDRRFMFFQNRARLHFYDNFEQALRRAPTDADYIALCDQDDVWRPDKLRALLDGFTDRIQLVYSDARVVDANGGVRSETFWARRRNNYTDLSTLMVANTITGAASMIRASLLPDLLPFPKQVGPAFHDHWIGLVALLRGGIGYVDAPLYDYVQHTGGVIGHNYNKWPGMLSALRQVLRAAPNRRRMAATATMLLKQSLDDYKFVLQKVMLARTLLLRNPQLPAERKVVLQRFSRFETSFRAALDQKIAAVRTGRPTLNLEGMLLWSIAGTRLRNYALRRKQRDLVRLQVKNPGARLLNAVVAAGKLTLTPSDAVTPLPASMEAPRRSIPALEYGTTKWIHRNILPLTLDVSDEHPKRVNLLLATIDFNYVFGGYIGMFSLALRLKREGYHTRIILHEPTEWNMGEWRTKIGKYPGITTLFDEVEVIARADRTVPVEVNPEDQFVATNCWAAHIAHHTLQQLRGGPFLFMAQEYEPYFMAMNSISALFQQAYTLPQMSLFSTELLRDFFRDQGIGVFARAGGDADAAVFSNAIQKFHPSRGQLMRSKRRLLFYARPEEHAARNLFELGMMALARVVRDPRVNLAEWSFHGIGSIGGNMLELAEGVPLELVPKTSLEEYIRLMPSFDVGLSLMLTPHPSLVPIEMASAGMWTVTNVFANKTTERLREISSNLIGVSPTVDAICDGLVEAMARVDDVDARLAGAQVDWPTDWEHAFPAESIRRIRAFLGEP